MLCFSFLSVPKAGAVPAEDSCVCIFLHAYIDQAEYRLHPPLRRGRALLRVYSIVPFNARRWAFSRPLSPAQSRGSISSWLPLFGSVSPFDSFQVGMRFTG